MQHVFGCWFQRSERLNNEAFERLLHSITDVLERDLHGVKVAKLQNGNILKIFRVKHLISSARIYSYARSFCRNSQRINLLGIPTVQVQSLYALENTSYSVVVYRPLAGKTVLQMLRENNLSENLAEQLGEFIANLHDSGVYFRGLHLGNIVLSPEGKFGLIDISEMTIFPWRLSCRRRLRNFARFWRTFEDKFLFDYARIHALIKGYHRSCNKVNLKLKEIEERLM